MASNKEGDDISRPRWWCVIVQQVQLSSASRQRLDQQAGERRLSVLVTTGAKATDFFHNDSNPKQQPWKILKWNLHFHDLSGNSKTAAHHRFFFFFFLKTPSDYETPERWRLFCLLLNIVHFSFKYRVGCQSINFFHRDLSHCALSFSNCFLPDPNATKQDFFHNLYIVSCLLHRTMIIPFVKIFYFLFSLKHFKMMTYNVYVLDN